MGHEAFSVNTYCPFEWSGVVDNVSARLVDDQNALKLGTRIDLLDGLENRGPQDIVANAIKPGKHDPLLSFRLRFSDEAP
jgi:hypothetical protein